MKKMNRTRLTIILSALLVSLFILGSVPTAAAQGTETGRRGPRARVLHAVLTAVKDATGLENADIRAALRDGKTLTEVVTENGGDPQAVTDAAKAQLTQEIDQALSAGKITADQAENARNNLDAALSLAMNAQLPPRQQIQDRVPQIRLGNSLVGTLADLAGITAQDIRQARRDGASLAEIAAAHGLTPDAVLTEAEARITAAVNQAVTAGKLTQDQADRFLNNLPDRLSRRLNAHRPLSI